MAAARVNVTYTNDHDGSTETIGFPSVVKASVFLSRMDDMKQSFRLLGPMTNEYGMVRTVEEARSVEEWITEKQRMAAIYGVERIPDDILDRNRMAHAWKQSWLNLIAQRGDTSGPDTRLAAPGERRRSQQA